MPNELFDYEGSPPDEDVFLWWDEREHRWHIWFGKDEMPMFEGGDFEPFTKKMFHYKLKGPG